MFLILTRTPPFYHFVTNKFHCYYFLINNEPCCALGSLLWKFCWSQWTWNDYLTAEPGLCSSVISVAGSQRELWKQRAVSAWTVSLEHEFQRGCRKEIMTLTDPSCPVSIVTDPAACSATSVKNIYEGRLCVCVLCVCMVCLSVWCLCKMYMSLSSEQNKV